MMIICTKKGSEEEIKDIKKIPSKRSIELNITKDWTGWLCQSFKEKLH